jgi:hypothetical protein
MRPLQIRCERARQRESRDAGAQDRNSGDLANHDFLPASLRAFAGWSACSGACVNLYI